MNVAKQCTWRIYLKGTQPKDGVNFTDEHRISAIDKAASAFNCSPDDLLSEVPNDDKRF